MDFYLTTSASAVILTHASKLIYITSPPPPVDNVGFFLGGERYLFSIILAQNCSSSTKFAVQRFQCSIFIELYISIILFEFSIIL